MRFTFSALITCFALTLFIGCGAPEGDDHHDHGDDHNHANDNGEEHHHAETFAEAVTEITEYRDAMRDAFAEGDTEKAHGPLHEVAHVLQLLPNLIRASELSDDQKVAAKEAGDELMELFGQVDAKLHDKEGKAYDEASAAIDAALEKLTNPTAAEEPAPADPTPAVDPAPVDPAPAIDPAPADPAPAIDPAPAESAPSN